MAADIIVLSCGIMSQTTADEGRKLSSLPDDGTNIPNGIQRVPANKRTNYIRGFLLPDGTRSSPRLQQTLSDQEQEILRLR
jgi:hypothetical protein